MKKLILFFFSLLIIATLNIPTYAQTASNETYDGDETLFPWLSLSDTGGCSTFQPSIPGTSSGAGGGILGLIYPALPNEQAVADSINNYIRERKPNSPWLSIAPNFGQWLINESKSRNINPFIITGSGQQENQFGTSGGRHVSEYHNYFGMKGSTPIDIQGSEYRGFGSPIEGMLFMMDNLKEKTQGENRGSYKDVTNLYEFLGVHQSGRVAYPGEPLDPNDSSGPNGPDGNTMDGWDSAMRVYISWDTTKNNGPPANPAYRGNTYNPGIYYKNVINQINTITGLTLSEVPSRGTGDQLNCGPLGGSGVVSTDGYSFPLEPQKKPIGGIVEGQTETRHHDRTPAFDLFSSDSADVYAIFSGTVIRLNTNYKGQVGCSTIQLHADDGFYYWYGHLKNPTISQGDRVEAGQKIAEIADRQNFNSTCWGGAPHLHIDRGCTINGQPQPGGMDECRDPDFIPFLSRLYSTLE